MRQQPASRAAVSDAAINAPPIPSRRRSSRVTITLNRQLKPGCWIDWLKTTLASPTTSPPIDGDEEAAPRRGQNRREPAFDIIEFAVRVAHLEPQRADCGHIAELCVTDLHDGANLAGADRQTSGGLGCVFLV